MRLNRREDYTFVGKEPGIADQHAPPVHGGFQPVSDDVLEICDMLR